VGVALRPVSTRNWRVNTLGPRPTRRAATTSISCAWTDLNVAIVEGEIKSDHTGDTSTHVRFLVQAAVGNGKLAIALERSGAEGGHVAMVGTGNRKTASALRALAVVERASSAVAIRALSAAGNRT
jgi:hypothetical protein